MKKFLLGLVISSLLPLIAFGAGPTLDDVRAAQQFTYEMKTMVQSKLIAFDRLRAMEDEDLVLDLLGEVNQKIERLTDVLEIMARMIQINESQLVNAYQVKTCALAAEIKQLIQRSQEVARNSSKRTIRQDDPIFKELLSLIDEVTSCVDKGTDPAHPNPPSSDLGMQALNETNGIYDLADELESYVEGNSESTIYGVENDSLVLRVVRSVKVKSLDLMKTFSGSFVASTGMQDACRNILSLIDSVESLETAAGMPKAGLIKPNHPNIIGMTKGCNSLNKLLSCKNL